MADQNAIGGNSLKIWLMAIRPKTLALSLGPVLLAGLIARQTQTGIDWLVFPVILISAVSIQIATNLWNDAADADSGLDKPAERLGPPRVTSLGLLSAGKVKMAAVAFLLLSALCGLYLVLVGGWPIMVIGIVGIICAFGYSSGPYPISGSPFGEVVVILFFGVMSVMGSFYLMSGAWTEIAFWAGFYIGLPAAAVLLVNNHRDRIGDREGGRRTLAIQLGPDKTRQLYGALLLLACLGLVHLFSLIDHGTLNLISTVVAGLLALYCLAGPIRNLYLAETAPDLNRCLAGTSMVQLVWIGAFATIQVLT